MNFSPIVYEHAARIINKRPWEVSRNGELLFQAHYEAYKKYHHSPVIVGIDIYNLEPETYGAPIDETSDNDIPAIKKYLYSTTDEIIEIPHFNPKEDGRFPMVIETGKKLKDALPGVDIRLPVSGPFSIASNLIGAENLIIDSVLFPDSVRNALRYLTEGQIILCEEIIKNGLGISFFDSGAAPPLISPNTFEKVLLSSLIHIFESIKKFSGLVPSFIIGGDITPILENILETGTKYVICPAETDQQLFMEKAKNYQDVMVRINMNANVLINDNWDIVKNEIDRVLELAKKREMVCIGTGVLPYETDPNLVLKIGDYISSKEN